MNLQENSLKQDWADIVRMKSPDAELPRYLDAIYQDLDAVYFPDGHTYHGPIPWAEGRRHLVAFTHTKGLTSAQVHTRLMSQLTWGAERLSLCIDDHTELDWETVFKGIDLSMVDLEIEGADRLEALSLYAEQHQPQANEVTYGKMGGVIAASVSDDASSMIQSMAIQLARPRDLQRVDLHALPDFMSNIALIRATQVLLLGLVDSGELSSRPRLRIHLVASDHYDDLEQLIELSAKAMSTSLTAVDELVIHDDLDLELGISEDGKIRMTQHLHWLLSYESGLQARVDRTNGSYFIEQATQRLFDTGWQAYQEARV